MKELITKNKFKSETSNTRVAMVLIESVLNDPQVRSNMIKGTDEMKDTISQNISSQLTISPELQEPFIIQLFQSLGAETELWKSNLTSIIVTNKRDAAFTLISNPSMRPIIDNNLNLTYSCYIEAIKSLDSCNDPFSGSIGTLFEAGKSIFSNFPPDQDLKKEIFTTWQSVAMLFADKTEKKHIKSLIKEFKYILSPNYLLDKKVGLLINERLLKNEEISNQLKISRADLENSVKRLHKHDKIKIRVRKVGVSERVADRNKKVANLRNTTSLTTKQIGERLNLPESDVRSSLVMLLVTDKISRKSGGPKEREYFSKLHDDVKKLRNTTKMTNAQIAEELNIKLDYVIKIVGRLLKKGLIERKRNGPGNSRKI